MSFTQILWLVIFGAATAFISAIYWRRLLLVLTTVVLLPLWIEYLLRSAHSKVIRRINKAYLKKRRWTKWVKRQTSAEKKLVLLGENLIGATRKIVLGEDSMIVLQKVGSEVEYVLKDERELPVEEQTVFLFRKVERSKIVAARDHIAGLGEDGRVDRIRTSTVAYELTLSQFCGWKNVHDETGTEIAFDERIKAQLYDRLPSQVQDELEAEFGGGIQAREEKAAEEEAAAE